MISRTKYQSKNLAIFQRNIYIINKLKSDKNYLTKVYTNLKVEVLSGNCLLTI